VRPCKVPVYLQKEREGKEGRKSVFSTLSVRDTRVISALMPAIVLCSFTLGQPIEEQPYIPLGVKTASRNSEKIG
jgi:hypothetical protein